MTPVIAQHTRPGGVTLQAWEIQSDTDPTKSYTVTEVIGKDGNAYLHCKCPAWPRSIQKGGCKHVIRLTGLGVTHRAAAPAIRTYDCNACEVRGFETVTDLNRHIERVHAGPSEADRLAAERILAWAR